MTDPVPAEQPRPTPVPLVARPPRLRAAASLPTPLTSFIGRQREIEQVVRLLRRNDVRLVTLIGPGGVGKTRLALHVARNVGDLFTDGVRFVDLAPVQHAAQVPAALAEALGVEAADERSLLAGLAAVLHDRQMMLLLDNLEQVIDGLPILTKLLLSCPSVKLLATSRIRLRVSGEYVVVVPPMDLPDPNQPMTFARLRETDAVRLFAARGEAARTTFVLTPDNAAAVASICRRLDALPLAIELAAARSDVATPTELLARLQARLPLLTDGPRDVPARHQGMRAAIAWSYNLLSTDEQTTLARLSVFTGGFALEAAESLSQVVGTASLAVRRVSALVAASLLVRDDRPGEVSRYRMPETIREFALERLGASGDEAAVRCLHASYVLELTEQVGTIHGGPALHAWLARLEEERANVRAALAWLLESGEVDALLRMVASLEEFWYHRGPISEGRMWSMRAIGAANRHPVAAAVQLPVLQVGSLFSWMTGDSVTAAALAEESLSLAQAVSDDARRGWALSLLGLAAGTNRDQAAAYFDAALDLYRSTGTGRSPAVVLMSRARVADGEQARLLLGQALTLSRESDVDSGDLTLVLNELGRLALSERRYADAGQHFAESLRLCWDNGDRWSFWQAIDGLASLAETLGDQDRAMRIRRADAAAREGSDPLVTERGAVQAGTAPREMELPPAEPVFAAPWSVVRMLPVKDVVAEALTFAAELGAMAAPEQAATAVAVPSSRAAAPGGLSPREREVLRLIADGLSDRAIAERLSITYRTTTTYVTSIFNKLGVSSRTAAVAHARRGGLL